MNKTGNSTKYSKKDYAWIKKQISINYPPGFSLKQIIQFSVEASKKLGTRPRSEKPPGRDKIGKIIEDGMGEDWKYLPTKGGRGNKSQLIPIKLDSKVVIEKTVNMLSLNELISNIKRLKKDRMFSANDCFEFVRLRNQLLMFPMNVYYGKLEDGINKDNMFESTVKLVKKQIEQIKKIEYEQQLLNKNFRKILENIDLLENDGICELSLLGDVDDDVLTPSKNALKRMLKTSDDK